MSARQKEQLKLAERCRIFLDSARFVRCVNEGTEHGAVFMSCNDEDARRMAACWNACHDVPTQVLESIGKGYGPTWLKAKDERDELLEALDWLIDRFGIFIASEMTDGDDQMAFDRAVQVRDKVRG